MNGSLSILRIWASALYHGIGGKGGPPAAAPSSASDDAAGPGSSSRACPARGRGPAPGATGSGVKRLGMCWASRSSSRQATAPLASGATRDMFGSYSDTRSPENQIKL